MRIKGEKCNFLTEGPGKRCFTKWIDASEIDEVKFMLEGNEIAEGDMAANGLEDKAFAVRLNLTPTKTNQCQVNVTWKHLIY